MVIEEGFSAENSLGEERSNVKEPGIQPTEFGGFYLGIPAGEMLQALADLGLGALAEYDDL
ncbi:hypothetical protein BOH72_14005 [Mycobacterium sp. WY10]|nr:hypothetical protein BOH72_14005 [Mycobacterium sp. WY10]